MQESGFYETSPNSKTFLGRLLVLYKPRSRKVYVLISWAVSVQFGHVLSTLISVISGLPLTALIWLSWVATGTVVFSWVSCADCPSFGNTDLVCWQRGLCLLNKAFGIVVVASLNGCFWLIRVSRSITFSICCGRNLIYSIRSGRTCMQLRVTRLLYHVVLVPSHRHSCIWYY